MNRFIALLSVSASVLAFDALATGKFSVDSAHSNVGFTVRHLVSKVNGQFTDFNGDFKFDDKTKKAEDVKFTVKTASINTLNAKRDEHLKSGDFFDAAKFPTIEFTGKKWTSAGKDKFKLEGDITMHGVTKPATFTVDYLGTTAGMDGKPVAGFTATTKINRKDFGIVWNKTMDKGGLALGEDVTLNLNIEAHQAEEKAAEKTAQK